MLTIRDHQNNEYPLLAVKRHTADKDGNDQLELTIHQQKNNDLDLQEIDKLWEVDYNNITYKILYIKKQTIGDSFYLSVNAKPIFYWDFDKSIIHENHDGSSTANNAFRILFQDTGYNFVLVDFSPSAELSGFGKGAKRIDIFKNLLDRYNYEFTIQGKTIYLRHLIGNDTNFLYKYKLNASNVSSSTDASGMFTHIKGFGNFESGEEDYLTNAQLQREYTSPLAEIVGTWEGPPIIDGRITQVDTMDARMFQAVEDSLQISVEGNLHDIRSMGYEVAVPTPGDRVWLIDERIDLEQEIRLHQITTVYDERDNIVSCDVTFGSQSIRERHRSALTSLSQNFYDLITGKLKLPVISLEQIGMDMINAIHSASSEVVFGDFGMQAISKTNPNHIFGVNSEGWYISQDGGATPRTIATANGIYADALFAGTLWLTNEMNIESEDGYLNITGSRFFMKGRESGSSIEITPDMFHADRGMFKLTGKDGRVVINDGYMRAARVSNINFFNSGAFNGESDIEFNGMNWIWNDGNEHRIHYIDDEYKGRYMDFVVGVGLVTGSNPGNASVTIRIVTPNDTVAGSATYEVTATNWNLERKTIRVDLQALYNSIPDYRTVFLYMQVQVTSGTGARAAFRVNRGEFND